MLENDKSQIGVFADVTLHTHLANRFFSAGWKRGHIGLIQFCAMIAKLYAACRADDPYADWYLMKTYKIVTNAIEKVSAINDQLNSYFTKINGIKLHYYENKDAQTHRLYLATQFCLLGAELLTETDQVLRQLITLQRTGIKQQKNEITQKMLIDILQEAFSIPKLWIKTDVTRNDIVENNEKAQTTKSLYENELPKEILNKEIVFSFLPKTEKSS